MFNEIGKDLDKYCEKMASLGESFNSDLVAEVKERLGQLDFLLSKVRALENEYRAAQLKLRIDIAGPKAVADPDPSNAFAAIEKHIELVAAVAAELRIYTEAFYFFAFRIRTIVQHQEQPLPYLKGFEAEGVRNVRNHLIEHPEGRGSRIFAQSFTFDTPEGPILKSLRRAGENALHLDAGLYKNAEEFGLNFKKVLSAVMSRV